MNLVGHGWISHYWVSIATTPMSLSTRLLLSDNVVYPFSWVEEVTMAAARKIVNMVRYIQGSCELDHMILVGTESPDLFLGYHGDDGELFYCR